MDKRDFDIMNTSETGDLSIINTIPINNQTADLVQKILDEDDVDKVKDLTALFNLNQAKKNAVRVMKLNALLDTVSDKMIDRFERYPDNFSNKDLLDYMQVTQSAIDRANKYLGTVDETPAIQMNQQINVNINQPLDRDSREKVADAVRSILSKIKNIEDPGIYIEGSGRVLDEENENE